MEKIMCDCGHPENDHSEFTRGYATHPNGETRCYECALAADIQELKSNGRATAYISNDGEQVTTWPGFKIATITGSHVVDFGYCRDQISFNAVMDDGTKLYGRGTGKGMYCRVRVKKG